MMLEGMDDTKGTIDWCKGYGHDQVNGYELLKLSKVFWISDYNHTTGFKFIEMNNSSHIWLNAFIEYK